MSEGCHSIISLNIETINLWKKRCNCKWKTVLCFFLVIACTVRSLFLNRADCNKQTITVIQQTNLRVYKEFKTYKLLLLIIHLTIEVSSTLYFFDSTSKWNFFRAPSFCIKCISHIWFNRFFSNLKKAQIHRAKRYGRVTIVSCCMSSKRYENLKGNDLFRLAEAEKCQTRNQVNVIYSYSLLQKLNGTL